MTDNNSRTLAANFVADTGGFLSKSLFRISVCADFRA